MAHAKREVLEYFTLPVIAPGLIAVVAFMWPVSPWFTFAFLQLTMTALLDNASGRVLRRYARMCLVSAWLCVMALLTASGADPPWDAFASSPVLALGVAFVAGLAMWRLDMAVIGRIWIASLAIITAMALTLTPWHGIAIGLIAIASAPLAATQSASAVFVRPTVLLLGGMLFLMWAA